MGSVKLNFDVLRKYRLSAVLCENEYQAQVLLDEMFRQYPELVSEYWSNGKTRWDQYAPYTAYALHIFDDESHTMQIASRDYWKSNAYKVVDFEDLVNEVLDLGDICEYEENILALFEME